MTRTFEIDTGIHIIREGWFKGFDKTEENIITYEIIHSYNDWTVKHMINDDDIKKEIEIVKDYL